MIGVRMIPLGAGFNPPAMTTRAKSGGLKPALRRIADTIGDEAGE